jgi:hypothetical protein
MLPGVLPSPATTENSSSTAMTTTLLITGVHMGAAKLPRALRIALAMELTP